MAEIALPDLSLIWASAGDILQPSDSKIQQGWSPEIPPRQWFNWLDNRQDEAIAHIAQHGIAVWSSELEYQAGKSYVQGSDGLVYKALTTHTNINPVGGAPGNWESAFITADTATQVATAAQARAMTANNVYLSPLQLANAFTGTNQSLANPSGYQKLPGGLIIQYGRVANTDTGNDVVVTYPIPFPSACIGLNLNVTANTDTIIVFTATTNSQFSGVRTYTSGVRANNGFYWIALGY